MFEYSKLSLGYRTSLLELEDGQISSGITFIFGPNGAGKSTLLKSFAGLLTPLSGNILSLQKQIAYLPARNQIQYGVTGSDLLELFQAKSSPFFSNSLLEQLGVQNFLHRPLHELSSGEAQRMILAAVLSHPSRSVVLDEPLTNLDWSHGFSLESLIKNMLQQGRNFLVSSHDFNWALLFSEARALVLFDGRVLVDAPVESALTHSKVQEVFSFKSQVIQNPLSHAKLLALANYDRQK